MADSVIKVENLNKSFHIGDQDVQILFDVNLEVLPGDFLVIFGPSGCGKSTLLHIILGLEEPTSGKVFFLGESLYEGKNEDDRSVFRKKNIGMIYQQPNWIKSLKVAENVAFPLSLLGFDVATSYSKAFSLLRMVGMEKWANYYPTELSSGQQQKIALVRALVFDPKIIIADEPTGNLDFNSGQELMNLMSKLNGEGRTIVMVTHDLEYLKYAKVAARVLDGRIVGIYRGEEKTKLEAEIRGVGGKRGTNKDKVDVLTKKNE
jgi:putative ABC transport system ATP-binding protein